LESSFGNGLSGAIREIEKCKRDFSKLRARRSLSIARADARIVIDKRFFRKDARRVRITGHGVV
jgi:hypothetical protein